MADDAARKVARVFIEHVVPSLTLPELLARVVRRGLNG